MQRRLNEFRIQQPLAMLGFALLLQWPQFTLAEKPVPLFASESEIEAAVSRAEESATAVESATALESATAVAESGSSIAESASTMESESSSLSPTAESSPSDLNETTNVTTNVTTNETTNVTTNVTTNTLDEAGDELVSDSQENVQQEMAEDAGTLSDEVANLKQKLIALNRDLFILEEDLLYPASTQVALFVSLDVGEFFALDSVQVLIDGVKVSSYLYTDKELSALKRGGIQRLYVGNLKTGTHEITAVFVGMGPQQREYKRAASYALEKDTDPVMLELKISDSQAKNQPVFDIREWE